MDLPSRGEAIMSRDDFEGGVGVGRVGDGWKETGRTWKRQVWTFKSFYLARGSEVETYLNHCGTQNIVLCGLRPGSTPKCPMGSL